MRRSALVALRRAVLLVAAALLLPHSSAIIFDSAARGPIAGGDGRRLAARAAGGRALRRAAPRARRARSCGRRARAPGGDAPRHLVFAALRAWARTPTARSISGAFAARRCWHCSRAWRRRIARCRRARSVRFDTSAWRTAIERAAQRRYAAAARAQRLVAAQCRRGLDRAAGCAARRCRPTAVSCAGAGLDARRRAARRIRVASRARRSSAELDCSDAQPHHRRRAGLGVELQPRRARRWSRLQRRDVIFLRGPGRWRLWVSPSLHLVGAVRQHAARKRRLRRRAARDRLGRDASAESGDRSDHGPHRRRTAVELAAAAARAQSLIAALRGYPRPS